MMCPIGDGLTFVRGICELRLDKFLLNSFVRNISKANLYCGLKHFQFLANTLCSFQNPFVRCKYLKIGPDSALVNDSPL